MLCSLTITIKRLSNCILLDIGLKPEMYVIVTLGQHSIPAMLLHFCGLHEAIQPLPLSTLQTAAGLSSKACPSDNYLTHYKTPQHKLCPNHQVVLTQTATF
jgi:hypothetical protein